MRQEQHGERLHLVSKAFELQRTLAAMIAQQIMEAGDKVSLHQPRTTSTVSPNLLTSFIAWRFYYRFGLMMGYSSLPDQ